MGFSLSWLAIRGKAREDIQRELQITPTGIHGEVLDFPCMGAQVGEWYVIVLDHDDFDQITHLSIGCEVVSCSVEEHVMVSEAVGWRDGKKVWSVLHDSQKKLTHIDAQGELPPDYAAIRERLTAEQGDQNDADYIFDIPIETARSVTGFRHDLWDEAVASTFEQLQIVQRATVSRGVLGTLKNIMKALGRK